MEIKEYVDQKKRLYDLFITFVEQENENDEDDRLLFDYIDKLKIKENRDELESFFNLIIIVSNNHYRTPQFLNQIKKIILFLQNSIKQTFSNSEVIKFSLKNRMILLILFKYKIANINDKIYTDFNRDLQIFFYPEICEYYEGDFNETIKSRFHDIDPQIFDDFETKRQIGENDSYLSRLIRDDSINEFVIYVTQTDISLSNAKIKKSIYETNQTFIYKDPTLIEYAAYYGSIKIFNFLRMKNAKLTPSLWIYAIHGRNSQIIHLLQEFNVLPLVSRDNRKCLSYEKCLKKAVKCHHNGIAYYIENNLISGDDLKIYENVVDYSIRYHNFEFFPDDLNLTSIILYFAKYNHLAMINFILIIFNQYNLLTIAANAKNYELLNFLFTQNPVEFTGYSFAESLFDQIEVPSSVKTIGHYAFGKCYELTDVKFNTPSSLVVIKDFAFTKCFSLTNISLPQSLETISSFAFNECENLMKITIPRNVKFIGACAFYECYSLTEVSFEKNSSLEYIGSLAFGWCSSLEEISLPSSLKKIGKNIFKKDEYIKVKFETKDVYYVEIKSNEFYYLFDSLNEIIVPSSAESIKYKAFHKIETLKKVTFESQSKIKIIKDFAFSGCVSLTEITLPFLVQLIGNHCFDKCSSLKKVDIQSTNIQSIKNYVFNECESLEQITIPSSVRKIGNYAFNKCKSLSKVIFQDPTSLISLKAFAFNDCSSLVDITLPSSLTSIGNYAFSRCNSIKKIEIPLSVKKIGDCAFYKCSSLEQVIILSEIKQINNCVFCGCSSLKNINIPDSVSVVCSSAFANCLSLEQLTLPKNLVKIGNGAFYSCSSLKQIELPSSLKKIGKNVFINCLSLTQIVIHSPIDLKNNTFNSNVKIINTFIH